MVKTVELASAESIPALGQGTWRMGENSARRSMEINALKLGIELGMTLIDTAEMYGEGRAEGLVAEAIDRQRDKVFLVSKVYPHNASRRGTKEACERSLRRLGTDRLDLYLLHWRGSHPLAETVEGFEDLRRAGKIRYWGVSNFDTPDMQELLGVAGGNRCVTNQILYNLGRRGPEFDLIPFMSKRHMPVMAYSPIEQGRLPQGILADIAAGHGVTRFTVALAWLLQRPGVVAIPKASTEDHVRDNGKAIDLRLAAADLAAIDRAFPPPRRKKPLEML
jgi:diketogulonate reductase-like aldo/keto reductase